MRSLRHPGPPAALRQAVIACRAFPLVLDLKEGDSVNAAVTGALARAGFAAGFARLDGLAVAPMRYVIPAAAPDASHAAWYSATHAPDGVVAIEKAGAIAGIRVNAVAPGPIDTPLTKAIHTQDVRDQWNARVSLRRYGEPREIGRASCRERVLTDV